MTDLAKHKTHQLCLTKQQLFDLYSLLELSRARMHGSKTEPHNNYYRICNLFLNRLDAIIERNYEPNLSEPATIIVVQR